VLSRIIGKPARHVPDNDASNFGFPCFCSWNNHKMWRNFGYDKLVKQYQFTQNSQENPREQIQKCKPDEYLSPHFAFSTRVEQIRNPFEKRIHRIALSIAILFSCFVCVGAIPFIFST
jgi:hypothetical protein